MTLSANNPYAGPMEFTGNDSYAQAIARVNQAKAWEVQNAQANGPGGTPAGGGIKSTDLSSIIKAYQQAQTAANTANEKRYTDILGQYQGLLNSGTSTLAAAQAKTQAAQDAKNTQITGLLENLGKSGAQQIANDTTQQQASTAQDMTSRGLGNTTIAPSMAAGIASRGQQNLLGLQENVAAQKAAALQAQPGDQSAANAAQLLNFQNTLQGQIAGVQERKTDQGPDMSTFVNLLQSAMNGTSGGTSTDWSTLLKGLLTPAATSKVATPATPVQAKGSRQSVLSMTR